MMPQGISRFAFLDGYYLFCSLNHVGQSCPLYAKLCRIYRHFTPCPMWSESRILADESGEYSETQEVYRAFLKVQKPVVFAVDFFRFRTQLETSLTNAQKGYRILIPHIIAVENDLFIDFSQFLPLISKKKVSKAQISIENCSKKRVKKVVFPLVSIQNLQK